MNRLSTALRGRERVLEEVRPLASVFAIALREMRQSRRARAGSLIVAFFLLTATFCDLVASGLPLLCRFHGQLYVLPGITEPASLAGYDCDRLAVEAEPGDFQVRPLLCVDPNMRRPHGVEDTLRPPTFGHHPLGTDSLGRDVLSRLIHGARTAVTSGVLAVFGFVSLGIVLGALSGFLGGRLDALVSRVTEVVMAFPTLVLVLIVLSILERPSVLALVLTVLLTRWAEVARLVRTEVLYALGQDYVTSARALGASRARLLVRHVMPNVLAPVFVAAAMGMSAVVLLEAALDFLRGGGVDGLITWGELLNQGKRMPSAYWLIVFPSFALTLLVLGVNLVADALRDAFDPRLRHDAATPVRRA